MAIIKAPTGVRSTPEQTAQPAERNTRGGTPGRTERPL